MYKVTVAKNVQDEMAPMLTITERATFIFDSDTQALMFCEMCTKHGFGITEYIGLQTTSVNGAVASIYSKFGVDITQ